MKYKHGKIFKKVSLNNNELAKIDYTPTKDEYYTFVKKQHEVGLRQVIITSEMMTNVIKEYFLGRKFRITIVEFMIEDNVLENEVQEILKKLNIDREYFSLLLDKLKFLIEENSIDIKKIELKGRENNNSISLFIQVNGIFGVNEDYFDEESEKLIKTIEECI